MEIMHWKDGGILVERNLKKKKKSVGNAGYKKHDV